MDLYLKGKTAIVSGASQGIGRAIAKELAMEGVKVFATARNEELLNNLKDEIVAAGERRRLFSCRTSLQQMHRKPSQQLHCRHWGR
ncbi:SDR family NAD(P)-dependent oxidoreductase [Chitinophaga filiformis]|uniref:SDR family NAD(P)-dependent oxidoreductase n=1 Tax=Chitinophaga filiformis TaxID=104663 RepID=UPI001F47512F|nr:SDR family NAD(P)-dependent oxidoreductase [Chitinophaga filiformis]MCF6406428.1 SDR family NAD(P)-dependent oxidoreductase [Chitinophaga filiformis]